MPTLETLRLETAYARLPEAFFSRERIAPLDGARLVASSARAAKLLDLDPSELERPELVAALNGERALPGADPVAMVYSGHQFGSYVPRLGDGRALLLGEVRNAAGEVWDLHLKGAGPTRFSRMGDGRSVLRSAIREFLASEALHALGVPTTRALCVIGSKSPVYREDVETGALLLRLAPCHVRFGTFEYFHWTQQAEHVARLADHVIARHHPELAGAPDRHRRWFSLVVERTARLVARWQAVGFAHGVLNTDNMSVLGLTLDYGPFGFLDDFDPGWVCNHSDHRGRYRFDRQPDVVVWNLARFAEALASVLPLEEAQSALEAFAPTFVRALVDELQAKLGLATSVESDDDLRHELLELLYEQRIDYTIFFRRLSGFRPGSANEPLRELFLEPAGFDRWAARYAARLEAEASDPDARKRRMDAVNPKFVLRGYLAENAIRRATEGDFGEVARLHAVLERPYDEQPGNEAYASVPPGWAKRLVVSCSS